MKNPSNFLYIFLLYVNFENLTIRLHVLIIFSLLAKFQENKKSITISSVKCLNFCKLKFCIKNKFIEKNCMCIKNIKKNVQSKS